MFLRMLTRAALVRRGRALTALAAVVVAAAVVSAMLTLYVDLESKLHKEFRSYGANVVVVASDGRSLPPDALARVDELLGPGGAAVPFAYAIARDASGNAVVVAGTDFERARRVNAWWAVSGWPSGSGAALVGARALSVLAANGKRFRLRFNKAEHILAPAGVLRTGAAEDSRVYLDLGEFTAWTGVAPTSIEIAASGTGDELQALIGRLQQALPVAEVRPVRQIVEAEGQVVGRTRASLLGAAAIITLTAALCVLATLTAWVLDRRKDFAIMKAIGASEGLLSGFFAAEAAAIGLTGALAGYVIGSGVAAWIGRANFHAAVMPRASVLPVVVAGCVAVALLSAALPLYMLRRVQPATMLRGE